MGYSPERRAAVLKRMLPPNNLPVRHLSQEEGISEATLHKWRAQARSKGQLLPDANAGPEGCDDRGAGVGKSRSRPSTHHVGRQCHGPGNIAH